ncbi:hypothetical protein AMELA_G00257810 [Ameiurus melas]|uniref:FIIND domain-containing protein n=1 Tax=Ameiurus melas TaxID=219545 RepID=A0A7J5ZRY6_AMEME|nr:hypothetical protein AMELA_G00257810 [Ameiurus melas]
MKTRLFGGIDLLLAICPSLRAICKFFLQNKNVKMMQLLQQYNGIGCKVNVLYRIVSWDDHFFAGLRQMEFAGPLYSIDCWECSIRHLTCEIRKDVVKPTVPHVTRGNVDIIQPLKVTDTHVIIDIQSLSLFGLLKSLLFQPCPIRAQVVLINNNRMRKLHIHLLPGNVPVDEVICFNQYCFCFLFFLL